MSPGGTQPGGGPTGSGGGRTGRGLAPKPRLRRARGLRLRRARGLRLRVRPRRRRTSGVRLRSSGVRLRRCGSGRSIASRIRRGHVLRCGCGCSTGSARAKGVRLRRGACGCSTAMFFAFAAAAVCGSNRWREIKFWSSWRAVSSRSIRLRSTTSGSSLLISSALDGDRKRRAIPLGLRLGPPTAGDRICQLSENELTNEN